MKHKIKKHISKYIAVACSLFFIPIFSINSFAYNLYDRYPFLNTCTLSYYYNNFGSLVYNTISAPLNDYNFIYQSSISSASNVNSVSCLFNDIHDVPVNTDIYDYYLVGSYTAELSSISTFTFFPSRMVVRSSDHNHSGIDLSISDVKFYHTDGSKDFGFSYSCKVDLSQYTNITDIIMYSDTSGLTMPANLAFQHTVISLPKDLTSGDVTSAIINAINNQTSQLGSQLGDIDSGIDKGNDLIENGTEDTQSAITDFNEVFEDFNNELDTWEQFDDDIIGEFNAANDNYKTELNNFSLSGSLLNAGTWLSTSMQTVYDNSSDYKMLWLVPLLFGIPILLFIIRKNGDDE